MSGVVLGGPERRRRWSEGEKVAIVAETLAPGVTVREVMERHGLASSLIYTWRKQARLGLFGPMRSAAFAPVAMIEAAEPVTSLAVPEQQAVSCSRIEIILGSDVRVLVGPEIDRSALETVLSALRAVCR